MGRRMLSWLTAALLALSASSFANAAMQEERQSLPFKNYYLRLYIYKPTGPGPFPVVLHSHGRASTPAGIRATATPPPSVPGFWERYGFAVVSPVRLGYGEFGGPERENPGSVWKGRTCEGMLNLSSAIAAGTESVAAALAWIREQPWVDSQRIILQGASTGAVLSLNLAAEQPAGVLGVVSFSGGIGGRVENSPGASCDPERMQETYRTLGTRVRIPSIWLYAPNDVHFGAVNPRLWHTAYAQGGSPSRFVQTAPSPGENGHYLMRDGGALWEPEVAAFLSSLGFHPK